MRGSFAAVDAVKVRRPSRHNSTGWQSYELDQVRIRAAFEHLKVHYGQKATSSATFATTAPPVTGRNAVKATLTALNALNSALTPAHLT
ncbi:hypothetical protein [Kibdelosporangium philippinense]|uniref:hypothetical protein n=1 Tax=Kibdelosporangium philippinense TaxID=211113 RepID=UPI00360E8B94